MNRNLRILSAGLIAAFTTTFADAQYITVTAGGTASGSAAYNGEDVPAYECGIGSPYGVCMDAQHNIYYTDQANNRVRKIMASTGTVTTVATISAGLLETPYYLCSDPSGNLYYSTSGAIKKIDAVTGAVSSFAGTGTASYSGDGGPAVLAGVMGDLGVCSDAAGNIYIADGANNRIREVNAVTGLITTIAGNGTGGYSGDGGPATAAEINVPQVICTDDSGNVYFADQGRAPTGSIPDTYYATYLRKITAATGIITTIAGIANTTGPTSGIPGDSAYLGNITGLWANHLGDIFITELSCSCRKLSKANDTLYLVAGNFLTESFTDDTNSLGAYMHYPHGMCMDQAGDIYFADTYNDRIRKTIALTAAPAFSYRTGQTMIDTNGTTIDVSARLAITNLAAGQPETWNIIAAPVNGALSGFPFSMPSDGTVRLTTPSGLAYTPDGGYHGWDSCKVMVTDGTLSDTLTLYINTLNPNTTGVAAAHAAATPGIALVPNPATDHFTITVTAADNEPITCTIVNTLGQVVRTFTGYTNQPQPQAWSVPAGMYMVNVTGDNIYMNTKMIKE